MDAEASSAPLASFVAKWTQRSPELRLALGFSRAGERPFREAFACLCMELESTGLVTRADEPATIKLDWWLDEFARAAGGEARHPLTRVLAGHPLWADTPLASWQEAVVAALGLRDAAPAADREALFAALGGLYRPLAMVEARLFAPLDAEARARQCVLARALEDTARLEAGLEDGRLPLPLDLMARHRLSRGELARASPQRAAALREWLGVLADEQARLRAARPALGALGSAALHAGEWRARRASRARSGLLAILAESSSRLPFGAVLAAWRGARRA